MPESTQIQSFITRIETMIAQQEDHQKYLLKGLASCNELLFQKFINDMMEVSENTVRHYRDCIKSYKDYLTNISKQ